ncbi:MAG: TnpV protein [Clostridia bacterium]|nr:TnpV protein [Clostridia bacterium]
MQKMTDKELLAKAEANEGLTVNEIKRYQTLVKPQKHVYGKYGTLKRKYLEYKGLDWTIENLPGYLHGVDKQAEDMYNVLYAKLCLSPLYKRTGEFMEDYRRLTALQHAIEQEILSEIIYTEEVV